MNLPELASQIVYARIGWSVVLAAVAIALAARRGPLPRKALAGIAAAALLLQLLPDPSSPAYWLGLAFQAPSALLVALCALDLQRRWSGRRELPTLPVPMAAALALAGGLLYLDASGWTAVGFYFVGFGPVGAPVAAMLLGGLCVLAVARGRAAPQAAAVLAALAAFMWLRLPTGNLWDALLDPLLWIWCVTTVGRHAWFAWKRRTAATAPAPGDAAAKNWTAAAGVAPGQVP